MCAFELLFKCSNVGSAHKEDEMRNMSFSHTVPQILDGTKDVTRRAAWNSLKPGDRIRAVKKSMGLKKGEKLEPLAEIEIVDVRRERLYHITVDDVRREGFPDMSRYEFVQLVRGLCHCSSFDYVNRIEFKIIKYLAVE